MPSTRSMLVPALLAGLAIVLTQGAGAGSGDGTMPGASANGFGQDHDGASDPGEDAMLLAGLSIGIALVFLGALRNLLWRLRHGDEGSW